MESADAAFAACSTNIVFVGTMIFVSSSRVFRTSMYLAPSGPPVLLLDAFTAPWSTTPGAHPWRWSMSLHYDGAGQPHEPVRCDTRPRRPVRVAQ
jgi:hypothetical protein